MSTHSARPRRKTESSSTRDNTTQLSDVLDRPDAFNCVTTYEYSDHRPNRRTRPKLKASAKRKTQDPRRPM